LIGYEQISGPIAVDGDRNLLPPGPIAARTLAKVKRHTTRRRFAAYCLSQEFAVGAYTIIEIEIAPAFIAWINIEVERSFWRFRGALDA
jgi:hypothetical protein